MEGLIKGLAEVVLGFVAEDHEEHPERQSAPEGEERSRSTWAEVVSTGKHEGQEQEQGSSYGYPSNHRLSRKDEEAVQESSLGKRRIWSVGMRGRQMGIGRLLVRALTTRSDILQLCIRFPRKIGKCSTVQVAS